MISYYRCQTTKGCVGVFNICVGHLAFERDPIRVDPSLCHSAVDLILTICANCCPLDHSACSSASNACAIVVLNSSSGRQHDPSQLTIAVVEELIPPAIGQFYCGSHGRVVERATAGAVKLWK